MLLWKNYGWFVIELSSFDFSSNFHMSGHAIIFSSWTITEQVSSALKKLLIKRTTSSIWCVLLWKDYGWFLLELSIFYFLKFHNNEHPIIFSFWTLKEHVMHHHINNMLCFTLEGLWIVSDRIVDFRFFLIFYSNFRFFLTFYSSGHEIFFSFWTLQEHVSYA